MNNNDHIEQRQFSPLSLSIITNREELPIGVVTPTTDWLKIKDAIHPGSSLYLLMENLALEHDNMLAAGKGGSIYEDQPKDEPEIDDFIFYKNEDCTEPDLFVQEYADRKSIVRLHPKTDSFQFVRQIN